MLLMVVLLCVFLDSSRDLNRVVMLFMSRMSLLLVVHSGLLKVEVVSLLDFIMGLVMNSCNLDWFRGFLWLWSHLRDFLSWLMRNREEAFVLG